MTKYYNKEIPNEIHFVYGNRYNGKTYYNFNKIKNENKLLKEELKCFKHHYNVLSKRCYYVMQELDRLVSTSEIAKENAEKLENIIRSGYNEN